MTAGDRTEYPIATLEQMAAIPEDAVGRFLAELPDILRAVRQIEAAMPALAAEARARAPWVLRWLPQSVFEASFRHAVSGKSGRASWIDDDKGIATISARWKEGDPAFYSRSESMRPASVDRSPEGGNGEAGAVEDESAVPKGDAQNPMDSNP